jgi:hypothetical protein
MSEDPQVLARQLLTELHDDLRERPVAAPKVRPIVWKAALAMLLSGIGVSAVLLVLRDEAPMEMAPARVVSSYLRDPCALRQASIMDAIDAYRDKFGRVPARLSELTPGFLPEVPLDPDSQQPYVYQGQGQNASISCPDPSVHAAARH